METLKNENGWPETKLDVRQVVDVIEGDADEKLGTEHDQRGMIRMGKKQELRRDFQFFSIWGFAVVLGCSWEYVFMSVANLVSFAESRLVLTRPRQQWRLVATQWRHCRERVDVPHHLLRHVFRGAL